MYLYVLALKCSNGQNGDAVPAFPSLLLPRPPLLAQFLLSCSVEDGDAMSLICHFAHGTFGRARRYRYSPPVSTFPLQIFTLCTSGSRSAHT